MRVHSAAIALVASLSLTIPSKTLGFIPSSSHGATTQPQNNNQQQRRPHQVLLRSSTSTSSPSAAAATTKKKKKKKLGLITFDLDDTLYPIAPVLDEANAAFSRSMSNFGYMDIEPSDIVETGKEIRAAVETESDSNNDSSDSEGAVAVDSSSSTSNAGTDPLKPTTVNHKEIRMAAIRKEMEGFILKTKLRQTAEDWATEVESLTSPVRKSAEKWARTTVHSSVVQAVYNAWEMERHHAAERHLFPDAISTIKQIQDDHPDVVVGAVTDGSANPMLMVFSLMPLFDFTVSWEDDLDEARLMENVFQELDAVDQSDELGWIYRLAVRKGKEMSNLTEQIKKGKDDTKDEEDDFEWCWVHVGDDLAYDVGGSATTGAKTVLVDLAPEYGQTARLRREGKRPAWTTDTEEQLENHRVMSMNALEKVDATITHLGQLPEAINELLKGDDEE